MTMSSPLLAPITVEAMAHNAASTNFVRGAMNYGRLAEWEAPEPAPFQNDEAGFSSDVRRQGVYVLWSLPEALRRGDQQSDGSYRFPFSPDRWLVVRHFWPTSGAATPQVRSWVVESGRIDSNLGGSPYLDPGAGKATPTRIGLKTETTLAKPWVETGAAAKPFLTAVAESCPAFAAYQPFNENVFSIFDDLAVEDDPAQKLPPGTLSYFVMGWYAEADADCLAQAPSDAIKFADLLKSLGWTASAETPFTTSTVFHGAANGVCWQPGGPPPPSPSEAAMPQVALGSTGVDGLVAFARAACGGKPPPDGQTPDQVSELIEAFEYDVMDKLGLFGAETIVEQEIRARWYQSSAGGTGWTITGAPTPPGTATKPPPPLTSAESAWLSDLNQAQADFDGAVRALVGLRRDLYEMWWKWGAAKTMAVQGGGFAWPWGTSDAQFKAAVAALSTRIAEAMTTAQAKSALVPHASETQTLSEAAAAFAKLKGLRPELALKPISQARYWMPTDPVALVSNTAHLLRIGDSAALPCRWPSEIASSLETGSSTISAQAMAPMLPGPPWTGLPEPGPALYAEFFLFDPAAAAAASAAVGSAVTADAIAKGTAGTGVAPALRQPWPWSQPWRPLFLDWTIEWRPIPFLKADGSANWVFDGLDYALVDDFVAGGIPRELSGRAMLSPKPSFEFKSRLDRFLKDHPDSPEAGDLAAIETLLQNVDQWDFLSQALGGLNTMLGKRNPVGSANPDASLSPLVGREVGPPPAPHLSAGGRGPPPASAFEGLRAGQFYVNRLSIVDAFGQTIEVVRPPIPPDTLPRTQGDTVFHPLLADGVAPVHTVDTLEPARFVQLPPRLLQPARLNFRFEPDSAGNAVAGWILPNHLDGSLMVYGANGAALGGLARGVDDQGQATIVWTGGPRSPYADGPDGFRKMTSENGRLGKLLDRLSAAGPDVFSRMVQAVDETLWTIDPLGRRSDAFLSVLVGRPLAVVAASLSLELQAPALRDPDWPYTFAPAEPSILSYQFPVRLGDLGYHDDGLIGYFRDQDFDQFNAMHVPDGAQATYFKAIAEGNYIPLGLADGGPGPAEDLTLLLDPRAGVHAQCALVPMKAIALPPAWVDPALAAISAAFATGPLLLETRSVPAASGGDQQTLALNPPAERHGGWSWFERDAAGQWNARILTAADAKPVFPAARPTLRDGVFLLDSGLTGS